jgi:hypothetical protein
MKNRWCFAICIGVVATGVPGSKGIASSSIAESQCRILSCATSPSHLARTNVAGGERRRPIRPPGEDAIEVCALTGYSSNLIIFLQERLSARGFYDGPADGKMGETFNRAVAKYREKEALGPGYVDGAFLHHLVPDLLDIPECE